MNYIDQLIANCEKAKLAKPTKSIIYNQLSDLNDFKSSIYIVEQTSGDNQQAFDALVNYKAQNKRSCPAINALSSVMYVGSSTTSVKSRIRQHIGDGPKGTYALHLSHWFEGEFKITVMEYDECREVIQIIEDALSDRLKPAFGKKGSNNK